MGQVVYYINCIHRGEIIKVVSPFINKTLAGVKAAKFGTECESRNKKITHLTCPICKGKMLVVWYFNDD